MYTCIEFQLVTSFIVQEKQTFIEVEGRFVKGKNLTIGNEFNLLLINNNTIPIKLKIDKIESFKKSFVSLSLGMAAKLLLSGEIPPEMENTNYIFSKELPILRGNVTDQETHP